MDCEREMAANAFVRQLDEIAVREGCDLPVTLLIAIMRLFDEQTESRLGEAARVQARFELPAVVRSMPRRLSQRCAVCFGGATPPNTLPQVVSSGPTKRPSQRITAASVGRSDCYASPVAARLPRMAGSALTTGVPHRPQ